MVSKVERKYQNITVIETQSYGSWQW